MTAERPDRTEARWDNGGVAEAAALAECRSRIPDCAAAFRIVWRADTADAPWARLSEAEGIGALQTLVTAVLEAACTDHGIAARRDDARAALTHGAARRAQGFDDHVLSEEFRLLRHILWSVLKDDVGALAAMRVLTRVDAALTLAMVASLQGYHRPELERANLWDGIEDRLLTTAYGDHA